MRTSMSFFLNISNFPFIRSFLDQKLLHVSGNLINLSCLLERNYLAKIKVLVEEFNHHTPHVFSVLHDVSHNLGYTIGKVYLYQLNTLIIIF